MQDVAHFSIFTRQPHLGSSMPFRNATLVASAAFQALLIVPCVISSAYAAPGSALAVQIDTHASLLSDIQQSPIIGTGGYGLRVGYRLGNWRPLVQIEHSLWLEVEPDAQFALGVLNLAFGCEYLFASDFVRSSLAAGTSTLLFETVLDKPGTTGLFLDIRPLGLRWALSDHVYLGFDPLAFSLAAPSLGEIPLIKAAYRTLFTMEIVL